jgi:hypothetical protein
MGKHFAFVRNFTPHFGKNLHICQSPFSGFRHQAFIAGYDYFGYVCHIQDLDNPTKRRYPLNPQ